MCIFLKTSPRSLALAALPEQQDGVFDTYVLGAHHGRLTAVTDNPQVYVSGGECIPAPSTIWICCPRGPLGPPMLPMPWDWGWGTWRNKPMWRFLGDFNSQVWIRHIMLWSMYHLLQLSQAIWLYPMRDSEKCSLATSLGRNGLGEQQENRALSSNPEAIRPQSRVCLLCSHWFLSI